MGLPDSTRSLAVQLHPGRTDILVLAPVFPLPWSHYVRLLSVENPNARRFYEAEALRGGWSVRQLDRQVGTQFYERPALSKRKAALLEQGQMRAFYLRWEIRQTVSAESRARAIIPRADAADAGAKEGSLGEEAEPLACKGGRRGHSRCRPASRRPFTVTRNREYLRSPRPREWLGRLRDRRREERGRDSCGASVLRVPNWAR